MKKNPRRIYLALDDVGVSLGYDADWKELLDRLNDTGAPLHRIVAYTVEGVRWQKPGTKKTAKLAAGRRKA